MEFVDQNEVAHQQGGDHRARGDFERLKQKRAQHKHHCNHREQACRPVQPPWLHQQFFAALGSEATVHLVDALGLQSGLALGRLGFGLGQSALALGQKHKLFGHPICAGQCGGQQQHQREIGLYPPEIPRCTETDKCGQQNAGDRLHGLV